MQHPASPPGTRPPLAPLDSLLIGAGEVFTAGPAGVLTGVEVGIADGRVAFVGPRAELPPDAIGPDTEQIDLGGRLLTPGLVECHTHLVFAGDRADEYALRATGASYLEIAAAGGGIASTMRATRAADLTTLVQLARPRLDALLSCGVTTCEIKSGYGLDLATELRILRAARALGADHPVRVTTTFLGAHTVPPELRSRRADYLSAVVDEMIPAVAEAGLAEFCDVFVEDGAFSVAEGEKVLRAGLDHGLRPKVHADQLTGCGGAELAASVGAVSADHLEHTGPAGIAAMAEAGTVAVLLPGASMFLGSDDRPPARAFVDAGVPVALSTDCNPGTCMTDNLLLMLTLGMSRLGLSPAEVLEGVTTHAARALGRADASGQIAVGRDADLAIFDVPTHRHLPYHFGRVPTWRVLIDGRIAWKRA